MSIGRRLAGAPRAFRLLAAAGVAATASLAMGAAATQAASTITASYTGVALGAQLLGHSTAWSLTHGASPAAAPSADRMAAQRSMHGMSAAARAAAARGAPAAAGSALTASAGTLLSNFDALSDTQNHAVNGFHDTPPDQGLCVGVLNGNNVVIEAVNSVFGIFTTGGTLLNAFPVTTGFSDPYAFSDPRCFWDASTSSFYMTVISCASCGPPGTADSVDDVLVVNTNGFATTYQYSSNLSGTCFGDQPHTGFDSAALYIATDEYCSSGYAGAILVAISKSQLAAQGALPNAVLFGPLSLGSDPILTLEPAFGALTPNEYLLNSFPYDQFGNSNSIANTLGFWTVTGDAAITSGIGTVILTGKVIQSETYAFPQPAASTGDGSTPAGAASYVISEPFLNPDDSRLLQVQAVKDPHSGLQIYTSLSSAVNIKGDPSARDGAAWFVLNQNGRITSQGYVAMAGAYLLYPAIMHSPNGPTVMTFTVTSPTMNPSAAYAYSKPGTPHFGSIQVAAAGTGAHVSFSDVLFGRGRWGDYSAAVMDATTRNVWLATEYIGGNGAGDLVDNWGTRIWEVQTPI